jgi:hypothetical protein
MVLSRHRLRIAFRIPQFNVLFDTRTMMTHRTASALLHLLTQFLNLGSQPFNFVTEFPNHVRSMFPGADLVYLRCQLLLGYLNITFQRLRFVHDLPSKIMGFSQFEVFGCHPEMMNAAGGGFQLLDSESEFRGEFGLPSVASTKGMEFPFRPGNLLTHFGQFSFRCVGLFQLPFLGKQIVEPFLQVPDFLVDFGAFSFLSTSLGPQLQPFSGLQEFHRFSFETFGFAIVTPLGQDSGFFSHCPGPLPKFIGLRSEENATVTEQQEAEHQSSQG